MLEFDAVKHAYYVVDGGSKKRAPSVTQIMQKTGIIDTRWYNDQAMIRGTYVHEACHYLDEDDLDVDGLSPDIAPYVHAYIDFKKNSGFIPKLIEQRVYSRTHGFAGTLDRIGILNGRMVLIDLKSGYMPGWVGIQTAAYQIAVTEMCLLGELPKELLPTACFGLQLKKDGKYSLSKELSDPMNRQDFLAALRWHEVMERRSITVEVVNERKAA